MFASRSWDQRSLLLRPLHKHCDCRSNALIDEHHEYLVLVAKENCVAAAGRSYRTDLNFDNRLTHTQVHILAFPPRPESLPDSTIGSRTGTITHATPSNSLGKPGVPTFVVNGVPLASGAQPEAALVSAFRADGRGRFRVNGRQLRCEGARGAGAVFFALSRGPG